MIPRIARQLAPMRGSLARQATAPAGPILAQPRAWARHYSSSQEPPGRRSSPSTQFYKTFGRPIAKVFLMAIFTYQLAYYFWLRLEYDEIKRDMQATIAGLEARVEQLEKARKR